MRTARLHRASTLHAGSPGWWASLALCAVLAAPAAAQAQEEAEPAVPELELSDDATPRGMAADEAQRVLDQPLPADPAARYALLQRQEVASRALNNRARLIDVLRQLVDVGRTQPGGDRWWLPYTNNEYSYGSQGRAVELMDQALADSTVSLIVRAHLAQNQTQYLALIGDRIRMHRAWSRALSLYRETQKAQQGQGLEELTCAYLAARSQVEHHDGDTQASAETLREMLRTARAWMAQRAPQNQPGRPDRDFLRARQQRDLARSLLPWALSRIGRYSEALLVSEAALRDAVAEGSDKGPIGRWHYRIADAQLQMRHYEAALTHATKAEELIRGSGASTLSKAAWQARYETVLSLIGLRRWAEADRTYDEFLTATASDQMAYRAATNTRLQALLAAKAGRTADALKLIESNYRYRLRVFGNDHPLTRETKGVRGVVNLIAGNPRTAMSDFDDLFKALLDTPSGWTDLSPGGARGYALNIAFDEFLRYVATTYRTEGKVDERWAERAMQVADRANLGVTHEALVDSTARVLAATPALRDALTAEQDQRKKLRGLFTELTQIQARYPRDIDKDQLKAMSDDERKAALAELKAAREVVNAEIKKQRDTIEREQAALNKVRDGIAQRFPAYADLVTPSTPNAKQLASLLQAGTGDEAVLMVQSGEWGTMSWLVTPRERLAFHYVPKTLADITAAAREARGWLDLGSNPAVTGTAPPAVLNALYADLLAPFEPQLKSVKGLIVATQGPLASVPFAALLTAPPQPGAEPAWLVKQWAVTQLPTVSALQALRRVPTQAPAAQALLGFGDPLFNPAAASSSPGTVRRLAVATGRRNLSSYDEEQGFRYADIPPLPETRAELTALAQALGADAKQDLMLGAMATRKAVLSTDLRNRRVVAFATHGLMPGELPGVSKPALAMAGTTEPGESPLLVLDDVLGLKLNAQWVVLSACNTAAGEQDGAAMSGLVRAFFFAGTRSVLATHWAVESTSAAALVTATFQQQASRSDTPRGTSLRQAQLAMAGGQLGQGRWQHPFYWAPYSLFGDPSR